MMLHGVNFPADSLAGESLLQEKRNASSGAARAQAAEHQVEVGPCDQKMGGLGQQVGSVVLIERDVFHIAKLHTCLSQAIGDSLGRKARPMLDAAEALLLRGRD